MPLAWSLTGKVVLVQYYGTITVVDEDERNVELSRQGRRREGRPYPRQRHRLLVCVSSPSSTRCPLAIKTSSINLLGTYG